VDDQETTFPVRPPWIEYPESEPSWGGWRQGASEAWLHDAWLPFWKGLGPDGRAAYLQRWPPPNDEWSLYISHFWI